MVESDKKNYREVRLETLKANQRLIELGLVRPEDEILTFGNVSVKDRNGEFFGIKPSGVAYSNMEESDIVLLNMAGEKVLGDKNPSTDTPTHRFLYNSWSDLGAIVHTHSSFATSFAQASHPIPCLGTTHADYFKGEIPLVPRLRPCELGGGYEHNTGKAIVEYFKKNNLNPREISGCLLESHGVFAWGTTSNNALKNAKALEVVAELAYRAYSLNAQIGQIPKDLMRRHFERKHGPKGYYGQKND